MAAHPRHDTVHSTAAGVIGLRTMLEGLLGDDHQPSDLERVIAGHIEALHQAPQILEPFAKLIPLAQEYVLAHYDVATNPAIPAEDAAFLPHQFCGQCATRRHVDDRSREAEQRFRFLVQVCMLRALSFKAKRPIQIWLNGLAKTIFACSECYRGFLRARRRMVPSFLHTFDSLRVEHFLDFVIGWEEKTALALVDESTVSEDTNKPPLTTDQTYCILDLTGRLASRGKLEENGLYRKVCRGRKALVMNKIREAPSGLLAFAIDNDEAVRIWADMQWAVPPMSSEMCTQDKTVGLLVRQAMERHQWSGFTFLVKMAPHAFSGAALPNTLLAHLSDDAKQTGSIMACLQRLLQQRGEALWEQEDREYPLVVLSSILDSSAYTKSIADQPERIELWSWVDDFLLSLKRGKKSTNDATNTEEVDAKVFEEALKRLAHFLLERFQQSSRPDMAARAAVVQAVQMLQTSLRDWSTDTQFGRPRSRAVIQVAALHAPSLAMLALRGQLPSSANKLLLNGASQTSALALVEDIFDKDCAEMSRSLQKLSNTASRSQAEYKRAVKPKPRADGTKATDEEIQKDVSELFTRTASALEVNPPICSELWKESYNACRPCDDIGVFLRPLANVASFAGPQINSHILFVKEQFGSLPAYGQYKERLKAALLSHTRRLRAMRGSLPMLLLDVSEVSSTQNAHITTDPTSLCYKLADGVVAANLCPEQEVHKAAQNIVRAAFEDAETRGDCFRSLIQCNPILALRGINAFLESFLVAATQLVEANDAAKWMVRSFSDVLEALCSQTDGLLRTGTPGSLIERSNLLPQLRDDISQMWTLVCKSVAVIFKRTPSWSRVLPHAELTAWFRDVTLFATEAVTYVEIFQESATHSLNADEADVRQKRREILTDLALPLEEASSWLRMNNVEIVQETRAYFIRGLEAFKDEAVELPNGAKTRMLEFIDSQSKIRDDEARMTLLSLRELRDLRHLLDPRASAVEIVDSDEDDADDVPLLVQHNHFQEEERKADTPLSKLSASTSNRGASTPSLSSLSKAQTLSDSSQKSRAKQTKLSFGQVDVEQARQQPFVSKAAPAPPGPRHAISAGSANRYHGASVRPPSLPSKPTSKLAQLRQDFNAAQPTRPASAASRLPATTGRELPEPQAPEAKRNFPNTASSTGDNRSSHVKVSAKESSSSSEETDSSDDQPKVGLADMGEKRKSPLKARAKPRFIPHQPQARRTILVENLHAQRVQREKEEAERKRRLREPANFNPLHRCILSWSYIAEGEKPPVTTNALTQRFEALRPTYRDPDEYAAVFEPMLLLECWAELQASKDQIAKGSPDFAPFTATINGRSTTDSFVVLTLTMAEDRRLQGRPQLQDTDVIYMRTHEPAGGKEKKTILGKVHAFKNHPQGPRLTVRCCLAADTQGMTSVLVANNVVEIGRLFSLTTMHRAYEALQALRYYDLLPNILLARSAIGETVTAEELHETQQTFAVNKPQAEAILSAVKAEQGFHLIQGPPGTGKTKTIASLVVHFIRTRKAPAVPLRAGPASGNPFSGAPVTKKILLCAPSNAAIDEVAKRVQVSVKLADGRVIKPNVVRVGRDDAINPAVKNISLDNIVEQRIGSGSAVDQTNNDPAQLHVEIRLLKDQRDFKRAELETAREEYKDQKIVAQLDAELRNISSRRMDIMNKLDEVKDKRQTATRQYDADRKRIQQEVLMQADVVCSTLGGAGHPTLNALPYDFETVIIDEAAQAVELDTLIPLRYGCKRCIMVGDPNQLPPTVISREAERLNYSQSLFVRLYNNNRNFAHLLSIQYRMNPSISAFPNVAFYEGRLQDGPNLSQLTARPWHKDSLLAPLCFVDCRRGKEVVGRGGYSYLNRAEAELAAAIYERLHREARRSNLGAQAVEGKVGVVTMYKDQVFELRRTFHRVFGETIHAAVEFNTVDGFQGQEKDIIILSCVRTSGIGFLNDFRRINVAITRAKSNLFVVGDVMNLERNDRDGFWRRSINAAREKRDLIVATVEDFRRPAFAGISHAAPAQGPSTALKPSGYDVHASIKRARASYEDDDAHRNDALTNRRGENHAESNGAQAGSPTKRPKDNGKTDVDRNGKTYQKAGPMGHRQDARAPGASQLRPPMTSGSQARPSELTPETYYSRPPRPFTGGGSRPPPRPPPSRPTGTRIAIPGQDPPPAPRPPRGDMNPRSPAASRPRPRPRPPPGTQPDERAQSSLFIPKQQPRRPPRPHPRS